MYRLAGILLLMLFAVSGAEAQLRALEDFDVRDTQEALRAVPARIQAMLERRRLAAASSLSAAGPAARVVANRHGLPKIYRRDGGTLTGPSPRRPEEIAKDFLVANRNLFAFEATDLDRLRLAVRDVTPTATFLSFNQTVDGIDVFNGHVKFTIGKGGEVVQAGAGDVIPGLRLTTVPRLSAEEAVRIGLQSARATVPTALSPTAPRGNGVAFVNPQRGDFNPITAELSVFPMDAETARLAYRIFVEAGELAWYEVLIDAEDGSLLFRHNLYTFAGQARVWTQVPLAAPAERETVNLPDEWLAPGIQVTVGNNADAYLDTNADNRPDTLTNELIKDGRAFSDSQNFDFPFADGLAGEDPRKYQAAAVTNLFYLINRAHDYYYGLGFTEAAGNFQTDNFGRGGKDKDPVIGQAQYGGFTNNASFATPADGLSPRMRMGIFTRSTTVRTDDVDSSFDGHAVLHEYGHGVSNRLVGGATSTSCLSGRIQAGAMGEGWSDYFAISYYDNPAFGMYTAQNSVRGIRRQNYEGYTFTYEDVGNLSIGNVSIGYEVHADGEVWAATLWDLRKALGKEVTDRLVVAGLKATPCRPSMIDARDAILTADQATNDGANRAAIWQVFSRHGMGYSARGTDGTLFIGTTYDAAYDMPPEWGGAPNPVITSLPLTLSGSMGADYSYQVAATNPNEGALAFDLMSGPNGMLVDRNTGAVRWMPGFVGQRVKIAVADGRGGKVIHGYHLPVSTLIPTGAPTAIAGGAGSAGFAAFDVPEGMQILQVTLRNGVGDPDLLVGDPGNAVQFSTRSSVDETLTFENPRAGRWRIQVDGITRYADVTLTAEVGFPALLTAGDSVEGLSGVVGSETLFRIPVPAGATSLEVVTSGGTGDADIYLRKGRPALCQITYVTTACRYDRSSLEDGNTESIVIENPEATDWYLAVSGYRGFSGVTLKTSVAVPAKLEPSTANRP